MIDNWNPTYAIPSKQVDHVDVEPLGNDSFATTLVLTNGKRIPITWYQHSFGVCQYQPDDNYNSRESENENDMRFENPKTVTELQERLGKVDPRLSTLSFVYRKGVVVVVAMDNETGDDTPLLVVSGELFKERK